MHLPTFKLKTLSSLALGLAVGLGSLACKPQQTEQQVQARPATDNQPENVSTAPEQQEQAVDVVIIGGGLSGLSTAYQLKKAGISYRVLEMEPRVGGRVRTGSYPEKTRAEVGLAEFWDGNPALEIVKELNVEMERVDTGLSSMVLDGKLVPFEGNSNEDFARKLLGNDFAALQTWDKKVEGYLHEIEKVRESGKFSPELMKLKDLSFASWLKEQKLPPRVISMIRAVLDPEIGTSIERISALDGIAEWHIFAGKGANPNHVKGGNQNLTEAIANAIGRDNIRLNTQVTNVRDTADGVEVRAMDKSSYSNRTFKAKYAVLAIPLYRMFEIQFQPRLSEDVYKAVYSQSWGSYFTAHVILDKAASKFWTVNGSEALPILTGGPLGVIYPAESDPQGEVVMVNLLVTGDYAEAFNARTGSLDDVQKQLEVGFEKQFPGIGPLIRKWTFYRYHPRAIASWPVGRSRFDALSYGLRKAHGHLYFGGDFTESSHSDGAVISANRVSSQIKTAMGK